VRIRELVAALRADGLSIERIAAEMQARGLAATAVARIVDVAISLEQETDHANQ
jgi:hypothetical protein